MNLVLRSIINDEIKIVFYAKTIIAFKVNISRKERKKTLEKW